MSRLEFMKMITPFYGINELQQIQQAYWFSKNVHRPQKRNDGERYFEHPLRVAKNLIKLGHINCQAIITALLHDVVEDTFTPGHVIIKLFGSDIWYNLSLLSKSRPILDPITMEMIGKLKTPIDEYFQLIAKSEKNVRLVKVADRVDNTRDLPVFSPDRQKRYIEETVKYIVPIAKNTDPQLLKQLKTNLAQCNVTIEN